MVQTRLVQCESEAIVTKKGAGSRFFFLLCIHSVLGKRGGINVVSNLLFLRFMYLFICIWTPTQHVPYRSTLRRCPFGQAGIDHCSSGDLRTDNPCSWDSTHRLQDGCSEQEDMAAAGSGYYPGSINTPGTPAGSPRPPGSVDPGRDNKQQRRIFCWSLSSDWQPKYNGTLGEGSTLF